LKLNKEARFELATGIAAIRSRFSPVSAGDHSVVEGEF
jgi:hypothetical protein